MSDNRHISRLKAILEDCGDTWDLSTNDKAAIQYAVDRVAELERYEAELGKVRLIAQARHPMGKVKHIGMMEVAQAILEVAKGKEAT